MGSTPGNGNGNQAMEGDATAVTHLMKAKDERPVENINASQGVSVGDGKPPGEDVRPPKLNPVRPGVPLLSMHDACVAPSSKSMNSSLRRCCQGTCDAASAEDTSL